MRDLFGVVQRGAFDGRSGQLDGGEVRHGSDGARAPDLEVDAQQFGERLLGLELVGYGPAGGLGGRSQRPPVGIPVDLHHYAVRGEGEPAARFVPMGDEFVDLRDAPADAHFVRDFESPFACLLQVFPMRVVGQVVARQLVERAVQAAAGHDGRRQLFERPCGGVARIGEKRLAGGFALGVETVERRIGHQDLSPYFEQIGIALARQHQRHAADRADVGRHVVARGAVAACHGLRQAAVVVGERNGRTVEFQFADEFRFAHLLFDPFDEFVQLVERIGIAQRQHREAVPHAAELRGDVAAHAHGGGVGVGVFGVRRFEFLQLAQQAVEFEIRDFRRVFDVVFSVMIVELRAQFAYAFEYTHIYYCSR